MGYQELIDSLKQKAKERIEELHKHAQDEIKTYREMKYLEYEKLKKEYLKKVEKEALKEVSSVLSAAQRQAYIIKILAIHKLSERLKTLAMNNLTCLREKGYDGIFGMLSSELPGARWVRIWINPIDENLAKRHFPDAEILFDTGITGGMRVETAEGITIDNTFEKRLERLLPEMLSEILKELNIL